METKEYKNDFFDRAEAKGAAKALVRILSARGIELTSQQHELVMSCSNRAQVDVWVDRAWAATSASDVFED
jgi:MarR-like DNA-binding transcriptional regulator SgrR of sgrS sRNA